MATKRSDWAFRLHNEKKLHLSTKFVTLTYADPHLKWKNGNSQLCKEDLQKWFKKVRKSGYRFRYYAVGEYGAKTYRPHYHVILFGEVPETIIRKTWRLGQVHIGTVTQASIMYCLGYLVNGKHWTMRKDRERPFALMSRRPGLGHNYLTPEMIEWHKDDRKNYCILEGHKRHLPRYYKSKIFSKIDHVRIAHRDSREAFKREVAWIRSNTARKMEDPIGYRELQRKIAARSILDKSKINLTI